MIKKEKISLRPLLAIVTILSSSLVFSGQMGNETISSNYVATLSLGYAWVSGQSTQTFFLAPEIEKTYLANHSNSGLVDGELFLGFQKTWSPNFQGQLGLAIAATSSAKLSGVIWDDADPQFNNLGYSYKVQHTHLALKGKLLVPQHWVVIPWVSGSIGVASNRAYSFTNTPLIFEAIPNPNFMSNRETTFTYTLGAGVQYPLTNQWQIGLGYEFADWGKSQLGRAPGQILNSGLSENHLYTNGVMFNITYIA